LFAFRSRLTRSAARSNDKPTTTDEGAAGWAGEKPFSRRRRRYVIDFSNVRGRPRNITVEYATVGRRRTIGGRVFLTVSGTGVRTDRVAARWSRRRRGAPAAAVRDERTIPVGREQLRDDFRPVHARRQVETVSVRSRHASQTRVRHRELRVVHRRRQSDVPVGARPRRGDTRKRNGVRERGEWLNRCSSSSDQIGGVETVRHLPFVYSPAINVRPYTLVIFRFCRVSFSCETI